MAINIEQVKLDKTHDLSFQTVCYIQTSPLSSARTNQFTFNVHTCSAIRSQIKLTQFNVAL